MGQNADDVGGAYGAAFSWLLKVVNEPAVTVVSLSLFHSGIVRMIVPFQKGELESRPDTRSRVRVWCLRVRLVEKLISTDSLGTLSSPLMIL